MSHCCWHGGGPDDFSAGSHHGQSPRGHVDSHPGNASDTWSVALLIDSTGLQVYGAGQWLEAKHGAKSRRKWRKLHLAVDAASGRIVAQTLTEQDVDDPSQVGPLLKQIGDPIAA